MDEARRPLLAWHMRFQCLADTLSLPCARRGLCVPSSLFCPASALSRLTWLRRSSLPHPGSRCHQLVRCFWHSQPHFARRAQGMLNGFKFCSFVAAFGRPGGVELLRPEKDRRPALPVWHDLFRLLQIEEVPLSRQDLSIIRADRSPHILRLARLLRDDDLLNRNAASCCTMQRPPSERNKNISGAQHF